jgi:Ser/Thr protein kinase RdoA (MazF antagonist)
VSSHRSAIVTAFPQLADAQFKVLNHSWDCEAIEADDTHIFKFPYHVKAETGLRRECRVLSLIRSHVTLAVPDLQMFEGPPAFSHHRKIPGEHLINWDALSEKSKVELADTLGHFYAQLHAINQTSLVNAGAVDAESWGDADEVLQKVLGCVPEHHRDFARRTVEKYRSLPPDPYGNIFTHSDGHGWNMAFDHQSQRLNGIFDFGDSGFAPLHREFVYAALISPELPTRIAAAYEQHATRKLDHHRIKTLTGMHRLFEIATYAHSPDDLPFSLLMLETWINFVNAESR